MSESSDREAATVSTLTTLHFSQLSRKLPRNTALHRDWLSTRAWGWQENVIGFGVGLKRTSGRVVKGQLGVTIFVRRKTARSQLLSKELIPERLTLASVGVEVVTDIVQLRSRPVAQQSPNPIRPICPGADISHVRGLRGTLGLIVCRIDQPEVKLALSCSHVIARSGYDVAVGNEIVQPPDSPANVIGKLDSFSTIFPKNVKNSEDFALAALSVAATPAMLGTDSIINSASQLAASEFKAGWRVQRNGIGSGPREGKIRNFKSTWNVGHMPHVGSAIFSDVVAYDTVNHDGDSGAAVLNGIGTEVWGIHFAGSPTDKLGLFLPIGPILKKYNLKLVTVINQ